MMRIAVIGAGVLGASAAFHLTWAGAEVVLVDQALSAGEIERAVIDQLRALLRQPEIIVGTWHAAREEAPDLTEAEVREALAQLDPLWEELFPAEQARIVRLLVERVEVGPDGAAIRLHVAGLTSLMLELRGPDNNAQKAAA